MPALPTTPFERIKSCADLLEAFFGARLTTVSQDTQFVIGTSVTKVMPQNPRRIAFRLDASFSNAGIIFVKRDETVAANNGFQASQWSTSLTTWQDAGDSVIEELWAVGTAAGDAINVREILLT
jgi:hypothetical protein